MSHFPELRSSLVLLQVGKPNPMQFQGTVGAKPAVILKVNTVSGTTDLRRAKP